MIRASIVMLHLRATVAAIITTLCLRRRATGTTTIRALVTAMRLRGRATGATTVWVLVTAMRLRQRATGATMIRATAKLCLWLLTTPVHLRLGRLESAKGLERTTRLAPHRGLHRHLKHPTKQLRLRERATGTTTIRALVTAMRLRGGTAIITALRLQKRATGTTTVRAFVTVMRLRERATGTTTIWALITVMRLRQRATGSATVWALVATLGLRGIFPAGFFRATLGAISVVIVQIIDKLRGRRGQGCAVTLGATLTRTLFVALFIAAFSGRLISTRQVGPDAFTTGRTDTITATTAGGAETFATGATGATATRTAKSTISAGATTKATTTTGSTKASAEASTKSAAHGGAFEHLQRFGWQRLADLVKGCAAFDGQFALQFAQRSGLGLHICSVELFAKRGLVECAAGLADFLRQITGLRAHGFHRFTESLALFLGHRGKISTTLRGLAGLSSGRLVATTSCGRTLAVIRRTGLLPARPTLWVIAANTGLAGLLSTRSTLWVVTANAGLSGGRFLLRARLVLGNSAQAEGNQRTAQPDGWIEVQFFHGLMR